MKRAELALVVTIAVLLAGCSSLRGKTQTAKAAPPAPKPVADAGAPATVRNLSVPQTNVELPPPQPPVAPEAIPQAQPAPPTPQPAQQQTTRKTPTPHNRTETPATATPVPATQPAAPPETEAPRPPLQEIVPAGDQKRLQDEAANCKKEVQQRLDGLAGHTLKARERRTVEFIKTFMKQSEEAESRADWRAAAEFAQRGLALARELTGGK
jgi:hypothetical protein